MEMRAATLAGRTKSAGGLSLIVTVSINQLNYCDILGSLVLCDIMYLYINFYLMKWLNASTFSR